jgi:hypothetical protein
MPLDGKIKDDIWSSHAKFQEFIMYRDEDMNLSLFSFYEFCTQEEQELVRISYMIDAVRDSNKIKFIFSDLYFIFYKFLNFKNGQV